VLKIPADDIAHVRVLQTVVGGEVVYADEPFAAPKPVRTAMHAESAKDDRQSAALCCIAFP
jgi:hypothetical protein